MTGFRITDSCTLDVHADFDNNACFHGLLPVCACFKTLSLFCYILNAVFKICKQLLNGSCTICECQVAHSWLVLSFLRNIAFLLIQERQSFTLLTSKDAN